LGEKQATLDSVTRRGMLGGENMIRKGTCITLEAGLSRVQKNTWSKLILERIGTAVHAGNARTIRVSAAASFGDLL